MIHWSYNYNGPPMPMASFAHNHMASLAPGASMVPMAPFNGDVSSATIHLRAIDAIGLGFQFYAFIGVCETERRFATKWRQ